MFHRSTEWANKLYSKYFYLLNPEHEAMRAEQKRIKHKFGKGKQAEYGSIATNVSNGYNINTWITWAKYILDRVMRN